DSPCPTPISTISGASCPHTVAGSNSERGATEVSANDRVTGKMVVPRWSCHNRCRFGDIDNSRRTNDTGPSRTIFGPLAVSTLRYPEGTEASESSSFSLGRSAADIVLSVPVISGRGQSDAPRAGKSRLWRMAIVVQRGRAHEFGSLRDSGYSRSHPT